MYNRRLKIKVVSVCLAAVSTSWAQTLYWGGGIADVADNAAFPTNSSLFSGKWNTAAKNWASTNAPGVYGTYVNNAFVDLGYLYEASEGGKATITNESDVSLSGLMSITDGQASPKTYNQMIYLTATNTHTLTFTGTNFLLFAFGTDTTRGLQVEPNVLLAGSVPISSVSSSGRFVVRSNSPNLTGPVSVRDTYFTVDGGALPGVTNWNLRTQLHLPGSTLSHSVPRFTVIRQTTSALDQLNDSAVLAFSHCVATYKGCDNATAPSSETIGKILLDPFGMLELNLVTSGNGSVPRPWLRLSDTAKGIDRGDSGTGMLLVSVPDSTSAGLDTGVPTSDVVVSNGVATGTLLPWIATTRAEFMRLNGATKVLEPVTSTLAPDDLRTWAAGTDYRIGTNSTWNVAGSITNDLSINSLGFLATNTSTLTIDSGKTLTLASGGLARMGSSSFNNKTFAITNGMLTSGTNQLLIMNAADYYHGNFVIYSSITGSGMDLIKAGFGDLALNGPDSNTYSGTTYVSGHLTAGKTGAAVAVPGDLVIQTGGRFNANGTAPIASTSAVTINEGGYWNHGAGSFTHGATVTLNGGCYFIPVPQNPVFAAPGTGLVFTGGGRIAHCSSSAGSVSLQTDVRYTSGATRQARWERFRDGAFNIELDGAQRTFDIADSSTLAADVPEMAVDTAIVPGTPAGGSLRKTGAGVLQLTDANTYTGGTVIDGGTIRVSAVRAPAQSGLIGVCASILARVTFDQPVAKYMAVRQTIRSASNTGITATRYITEILNDYQIITDSTGGIARFKDVSVDAISRSGTLGTGAVTVNSTGTLMLDAGIGLTNAVTVYTNGTLAASGAGIGSLAVNGGTLVATPSAGALAVSNTVSLTSASLQVSGTLGTVQTVLTAGTSLTGTFATVSGLPGNYKVTYTAKQVLIKRITGTLIRVS